MNKQAQNKATQKFPMILILAAGILIAGLGGWVAFNHYQKTQDRARFSEAETIKADIVKQLQEDLGDKALQVTENNQCFNTEQGPYDEGKLWCQTVSSIQLTEDIDFKQVAERFLEFNSDRVVSKNTNSNDTQPVFNVMLQGGIICNLVYTTGNGDVFGTMMNTKGKTEDNPSLSLACANRAKAKHYPFTE